MRASTLRRVGATTRGDELAQDPVRISSKVSREVAGLGSIHRAELRQKLGLAWFVYMRLLDLRDDRTGAVRGVTAKLIARALPRAGRWDGKPSENAVKKHLQTLEALGLVSTVAHPVSPESGPKRRLYYREATGQTRWKLVIDRKVFGAPGVGASDLFAIPVGTEALLQAAPAQGGARANSGGKRAGAGRPKGVKTGMGKSRFGRHRDRGSMSVQRLIAKTEELFPGSIPAGASSELISKRAPGNSNEGPSVGVSSLLYSLLFPTYSRPTSLPSIASLPNGREGAAAPPPFLSSDERENGIVGDDDLAPRKVQLVSPFVDGKHKLFPPYVSAAAHPELRLVTPPPPRLNRNDTPERHAYLLMRWYEGACRSVLGKEPGTFKRYRQGPAASPHFALLTEAAAAFVKHDVAPAAWCAFSADVWRRMENKGLPPLKFVFSAKRVEERAGWYRSEESNYSGGRVLWTPTAREFATRQANMRCVPSRIQTEEELKTWVEKYFPNKRYQELLTQIREETSRLRDELASAVELGNWLW